ncbi:MAG: T9SS type A sorting domain-containing protein [Melioribacteraceae bacterium]|nr:T9SS type A sorting domain-containing protein [Melioribacteraceae bacterium]
MVNIIGSLRHIVFIKTIIKNIALIILIATLFSLQLSAQDVTITIPDVSYAPNTEVLIPINITDLNDVGAITLKFQYDTDVLTYIGSDWNSILTGGSVSDNNSTGLITIGWYNQNPANQINLSKKILDLEFQYKGGFSELNFTFVEITNSSAVVYSTQYSTGSISQAFSSIALISPNGGETWRAGTTQNITWTNENVDDVKIEYSTDNGATWTTIVSSAPASAGSFNWKVPATISTLCKVRISDVSNATITDECDNTFSIIQIYSAGKKYVPDDFTSIQVGIDNSNDGDTIIVRPGIYYENISLIQKNIVLGSNYILSGDETEIENTIIDGNGKGSVITVRNVNSACKLVGFTIQHGRGTEFDLSWQGGNITTSSAGGGIAMFENAKPVFSNLVIKNNTASFGGGIYCEQNSYYSISNSTINNNTVDNHGSGGGIYCHGSDIEITDCEISNNFAYEGAGISFTTDSDPRLERVIIHSNRGDIDAALHSNWANPYMKNVTITNNVSTNSNYSRTVYGYASNIRIYNSIIWNNDSDSIHFHNFSNNYIEIENSDIKGGPDIINFTEFIPGEAGTLRWLEGNFDANPKFCDPNNDNYSLQSNSPCININQYITYIGAFSIGCDPVMDKSITIISPNGGETWRAGSTQTISWTSQNVDSVDIYFNTDGSLMWSPISLGIPASARSYTWTVPNINSSNCLIKVNDTKNNLIDDESDNPFSITVQQSLIVYFPFNGNANDESGNQNNCTVFGASLTTDRFGNPNSAYSFDGGDDFIISDNEVSWEGLGLNENMTVSYWALADTTWPMNPGGDGLSLAVNNAASDIAQTGNWWSCGIRNPSGEIALPMFTIWNNEGTGSNYENMQSRIDYSKWNHYVFTFSGGNRSIIYLNGKQISSLPTVSRPTNHTGKICIGKSGRSNAAINQFCWNGKIDEIRIYNTILTASQVDSVYLEENPGTTTSTIRITAPNGGENWYTGSTHLVSYVVDNVDKTVVEYSLDNGSSWNVVTTQTHSSSGGRGIDWTLPNEPSEQCLLRVSSTSNPDISDVSDSTFTISVPDPNLVACYSFSGNANDETAHNLHGSVRGAPQLSNDRFGKQYSSYYFDGVDDYITIDHNELLNFNSNTDSYSISLWFKSESQNASHGIILRKGLSQIPAPFDISFSGSDIGGEISISNNSAYHISYGSNLWDNNWHHLVFIINRETGRLQGYIDKNEVASLSYNIDLSSANSDPVYIGGSDQYYKGFIDDIKIFDKVLEEDAVYKLYFDDNYQSDQPIMRVVSPNGGEIWETGTTHNITWTSVNVDNAKIEFSTNNGSNWITIVNSTPASAGSHTWTVPNVNSVNCLVRISDVSNTTVSDISDGTFTITEVSSITVTSPNGGENWETATRKSIIWSSSNVANVKIEYSTNNGAYWSVVAASTESDGIYEWIIPDTPSSECLVRISDADDSRVTDVSDNTFTIRAASSITVKSPNGGEEWEASSSKTITWTSTNVVNVKIEFSINNGTSWSIITPSTQSDGIFEWDIPVVSSTQCFIKISDINNAALFDISDNSFTITEPQTSITLTSPNGGEEMLANSTVSVNWECYGVNNIEIELSTDNGMSWIQLAAPVDARDYSYGWSVPDVQSTNCKMKLTSLSDPALFDISDAVFAIIKYGMTYTINKTLTFYGGNVENSYRMIGLPGNINLPVSEAITGAYGNDWRAFYDNGSNVNYLAEYSDGSTGFNFLPGNGFWIISKNGVTVNQVVNTVPLSSDNTYSINLHPGWNIISNPFNKVIMWGRVSAINDTIQSIFSYDGSYAANESAFTPYEGYYFYNVDNKPAIKIPFLKPDGNLSVLAKESNTNELNINLIENNNKICGCVYIGFNDNSKMGFDKKDKYAPPPHFVTSRIVLYNEELHTDYKYLYKDYRSMNSGPETYKIIINKVKGSEYKFLFNNLSAVGDGKVICLIDNRISNAVYIDNETIIIPDVSHSEESYTLIIGKRSDIDQIAAQFVPGEYQLYQNYPNPFNNSTIIRFSLPLRESVTLEVYTILGEKIFALLKNQTLDAGNYEYNLELDDCSSGVYLYRLRTNNINYTRKLVLIK